MFAHNPDFNGKIKLAFCCIEQDIAERNKNTSNESKTNFEKTVDIILQADQAEIKFGSEKLKLGRTTITELKNARTALINTANRGQADALIYLGIDYDLMRKALDENTDCRPKASRAIDEGKLSSLEITTLCHNLEAELSPKEEAQQVIATRIAEVNKLLVKHGAEVRLNSDCYTKIDNPEIVARIHFGYIDIPEVDHNALKLRNKP